MEEINQSSQISNCRLAPTAGDLLRLAVPVAGLAIGAFLAFGPYLHPTRIMKAVLFTVPTLVSLVAFRALRRAAEPEVAGAEEVGEKQILPRFLEDYRNYMSDDKQDYEGASWTISLSDKFIRDIHRQVGSTYFEEQADASNNGPKSYWQLNVGTAMDKAAVPIMVEQLLRKGFTREEIEKLGWVWHQGPAADLLKRLYDDFHLYPMSADLSFLGRDTDRVWKIYRESGDLIMGFQLCGRLTKDPSQKVSEGDIYTLSFLEVNLRTGVAETKYKTAGRLDLLKF